MMQKNKFILSSFFLILLGIIFVTLCWDYIKLNFNNQTGIVSNYSQNNHHQLNDTLRFIFFISVPLLLYFLNCFYFFKNEALSNCKSLFLKSNNIEKQNNNNIKTFCFLFTILIFFLYLSKDLSLSTLDIFHEGQYLGGGFNYLKTGNFWKDNFVGTGLFVDVLLAPTAWNLFGEISIGSFRLLLDFLNLITQVTLIYLFYNVIISIGLSNNLKTILIIPFFVLIIYMSTSNYLSFRDVPILLSLSFLLKLFQNKNKFKYELILLGFLSIISLLISLEKGLYLNFLYFFLIIIFFLLKKYQWILYLISSIFLSWLLFYFIVGSDEFKIFFNNSTEIIKSSEILNGIIYPNPFSDMENSSRATKNLIVFILNGIFLISLILFEKQSINSGFKIFSILLFVESLAFYKTGLSRSDGVHLKHGIALAYIQFLIFLILSISISTKKNFFKDNFLKKYSKIFSLIFLFIVFFSYFDLRNTISVTNRIENYTKLEDKVFLHKEDYNFIQSLNNLLNLEDCIQVLNYEPATNYLVRKKTCTKYNLIFVIGSKLTQKKVINEISKSDATYIVTGGHLDTWAIDPKLRYSYIYKYLSNNYVLVDQFNNRKLFKKN